MLNLKVRYIQWLQRRCRWQYGWWRTAENVEGSDQGVLGWHFRWAVWSTVPAENDFQCHTVSAEIYQGLDRIHLDSSFRIIFQLSGYNHCLLALFDTSCDSWQRWKKFSKLKLIKTFLRSTMSQVRLSSLAILSSKSRCLEDVDTDKIIDSFANNKARKKSF